MPEILGGRYALLSGPPRSGGTAVVRKATDINNGGFVAVKFLVTGADSVLRTLFQRESELLRRADHANIIKFVDAGVDDTDTPYVVLAWVEDHLDEVFDRYSQLGWDEFVAKLLNPLADAVAYLHRQSIEHRDIKAINVLADSAESPLLADFGIAKQHDESTSTQTVSNFGTFLWSPPEGATALPYTRDVWALGVMCIYGLAPRDGRPKTYDDLSEVLSTLTLPTGLNELIASAIERDGTKRPHNAIEFVRKLESALASHRPVGAKVRIYLQLTRAAQAQLAGTDGLLDNADSVLLQDLKGDTWVSSRWDSESNGYDPTVLFITGEEFRITAKRDIGRSWYVATGVSRLNYDDLERSRDLAMKVTDFVSWTTQMPLDLDASNAAYDLLVGRVSEFLLQRDEEALGQQGVSQIVGAWRRLLDAREAILSEDAAELEFASFVDRSERETNFTLLAESEEDLLGTEWLIYDEVRDRSLMRGNVVHQRETSLSIRWTWRRNNNTNIPLSLHRLRPHLGPTASALVRQREALRLLETGSTAMPELSLILENPEAAREPRPQRKVDWQSVLDENKKQAVKAALGLDDIMVVTGPPGSGKTRLIAETVYQFLATNPEAQILIVSQTHVAVDNAIERLSSSGIQDIVRIGKSDDERISDTSRKLILENRVAGWAKTIRDKSERDFERRAAKAGINEGYLRAALVLEQFDSRRRQIEQIERALKLVEDQSETASRLNQMDDAAELQEKLRRLEDYQRETLDDARRFLDGGLNLGDRPTQEDVRAAIDLLLDQDPAARPLSSLLRLQGEWLQRLEADDAIANLYIQSSRVIAGTCLGFLRTPAVRDVQFDLCIIDEASKATSTEALVPAVRSRRIVLVGDESQLPPIDEDLLRRDDLLDNYELNRDFVKRTLFSRLVETLPEANRFMLNEQYRMIAPIGNLVSECFYNGVLNSPIVLGIKGYEYLGRPICWIDTSANPRRYETRDTNYVGSYVNRCEADIAFQRLRSIDTAIERGLVSPNEDGTPYNVLLISPYRGQIGELKRRLASHTFKWLFVDVESVDAVQGREADFVVFSVTRSNSSFRFGFLGRENWRRINVAVSRARFGLTIIGDSVFSSDDRSALSRVLTYMRRHPSECEIRSAHVSD